MKKEKLILIIEDEPDTAWLLEYHLERSGFRTVWKRNGVDGFTAALQDKPDLVILDLMLPEMHGLEVCRGLKSNPVTEDIPILLLTAYATLEDKLQGFGRGADDFMSKPFETSELIVRVFALLRRSGSARSVGEGNPNSIETDEANRLPTKWTSHVPRLAAAEDDSQ